MARRSCVCPSLVLSLRRDPPYQTYFVLILSGSNENQNQILPGSRKSTMSRPYVSQIKRYRSLGSLPYGQLIKPIQPYWVVDLIDIPSNLIDHI
ncbi:hypothetical protein CEXT_795801 [Caerostris extrusa]|uniref:Uncharacterized protein n=1 Tax=Caerostris extrusa TaxID=172846 RepID=A0AAV4UEE8_CAEEX|nr:hypothetical protein CEXT_795801 [Caerostris extrusa]